MDCVKSCGAVELALQLHDERKSGENPSIFRGLVDLMVSIDSVLEEQLQNATAFKATLKTVQNELLDCLFWRMLLGASVEPNHAAGNIPHPEDQKLGCFSAFELVAHGLSRASKVVL
ncbi:hypothetical protein JOB18_027054 [Solea senegalensis]|uniref:Uncharacterized protein n=1 Tax=Solea senegalensis TaxID=28829 RepID=A0AAV6RNY7_SOLSE|nr:hypothetical protein JOB18_027054 [Solea senegalensis]